MTCSIKITMFAERRPATISKMQKAPYYNNTLCSDLAGNLTASVRKEKLENSIIISNILNHIKGRSSTATFFCTTKLQVIKYIFDYIIDFVNLH
ncbi:hypothetical protein TPENAI_20181 [Tenacibaculum litopenaei]